MKNTTPDFAAIISAPGFSVGIVCDEDFILEVVFLPPSPERPPANHLAEACAQQVLAYLTSPDHIFKLPLAPAGTTFQQRVWQEIAAIPRGETRTYGQLAKNLKNAPRAVGQACGANPYPLITPCHRVISAQGLGGFNHHGEGYLLDIKRWLLRHESPLSSTLHC